MNARERTLLVALLGVVGLGVFAIAAWVWFLVPLREYNARIRSMQEENAVKQAEMKQFQIERKKLVLARMKSLPANQNEAASEYISFLQPLLIDSGLSPEEIRPSNPVEVKPVSNIPGVKKVGHQMMTFQVRARGTLSQLISAMEEMRHTPYEHRIKNLTIDRADNVAKDPNARLIINMLIETLLVAKTDSKPGIPPGVDMKMVFVDSLTAHHSGPAGLGQALATVLMKHSVLPEGERNYADIAKRNIFVGELPKPAPIVKGPTPEPKPPPPPKAPGPIPAFIRLTQIDVSTEKAHYLNLFYRKDERMISADKKLGHDTFLVDSDDGNYVFFLAKVLRVDNRAVFIQIKDKVHQWNIGDTLDVAVNVALSDVYMQAIDLEPDFDWGKKELEKEKSKAQPTKKKYPSVKGR